MWHSKSKEQQQLSQCNQHTRSNSTVLTSSRDNLYTEYDDVTLRRNDRMYNRLQSEQRTIERAQKVVTSDIEKEQRKLEAFVARCRLEERERRRVASATKKVKRATPKPEVTNSGRLEQRHETKKDLKELVPNIQDHKKIRDVKRKNTVTPQD